MLTPDTDVPSLLDASLYPSTTSIDGTDLVIGGCSMSELAAQVGTPAYVLDEDHLRSRARRYLEAFTSRHPDTRVLFASKSFPAPSVIRLMVEEGCGVDVASGEELAIARAAGADPADMVLHGNAKTDTDIAEAMAAGVGLIVIDNLGDVERISRLAEAPVRVLLRVSPQVEATTHEKMMTGSDTTKFGIPSTQAEEVIRRLASEPSVELVGLHAHVGSGLADLSQFEAEVAALSRLERFPVYNFGGGLGERYIPTDRVPSVEEYADRLVSATHRYLGTDVRVMVEPGRSMVARGGVTVYRVVTVKRGARTHVAVDGGMGDNLEVALYGQPFAPSVVGHAGPAELCDVVGRHCESGDYLAQDVYLADPRVGDLITIPVTGAYCYTMSNNYNGALRPPVVLVKDGAARVVVRRETREDLLRRDVLSGSWAAS